MVAYEPEGVVLRVSSGRPAMLVLADARFPGWTARIDGAATPLVRADLVLRAVAVAPGPREVVFEYNPLAVRLGVWMSAAALIVGAALALGPLVCRRWRGVPSSSLSPRPGSRFR